MNKVQNSIFRLLLELDEICKKNDIEYCLCGGCALGIERHYGFIPWDDDIDLFITRENYKKLDKVLKETEIPGRAWVTQDNYENYDNPLSRYVDLNTTQITKSRIGDGTPQGQMVEFFILDPYPNSREEQEEYNKYMWLYCELQASRFVAANIGMKTSVVDSNLYDYYSREILNRGKKEVLDEIERNYLTYDIDSCDYMCSRWGIQASVIKKEWIQNLVRREFEGHMLPFFKDNIEYLYYTEYGYNWNFLPSEKARTSHNVITSINTSYKKHWAELEQLANKNNFVEVMTEAKREGLKRKFVDVEIQELVADQKKVHLEILAEELQKTDLKFDFEKIEEYKDLFSEYFGIQTEKRYYKAERKADISEELFEIMVLTLIYSNKIDAANIYIDLYRDYERAEYCRKLVEQIVALKHAKYSNKIEDVAKYLGSLEKDFGVVNHIEVDRTRTWYKAQSEDTDTEERILELYDSIYYQDDYENKKYIGDLYYNLGNIFEAEKWYMPALSSLNGMLLLDINRKGFHG